MFQISLQRHRIVSIWALLSAIQISTAQQYLAVNWSSTTYGPDGPWNAITIKVGGNQNSSNIASEQVSVDLLVGSYYASYIPSSSACRPYGPQCGTGGEWDPDTSVPSSSPPNIWDAPSAVNITGTVYPAAVTIGSAEKQQTIYDVDLATIDAFSVDYPNQKTAAPELGFFALNSGNDQSAQALNYNKDGVDPWIVAGALYNQSIIPSYSYGLQIGSAALDYGGSLILGGYDKGRAIGPYTSYAGYSAMLLDISINVETGSSPFPFGNASGLLMNILGQPDSLIVKVDPMPPGLHLPAQTCSALAEKLPIYFDQTTQYYLWNTSDPSYETIINSPAYLGFHFTPAPGDDANVTIKVPFKLLNLTLTSPVVSSSVQYFPCMPFNMPRGDQWRLGRAFLQGAFLGYNTQTNTMWLAQAPGPGASNQGLGYQPQNMSSGATTLDISNDQTLFAQSWANHWTPYNDSKPSTFNTTSPTTVPNSSNTHHKTGLSGGAIAGIVIGVIAGVVLIAASITYLLTRRRKQPFQPVSQGFSEASSNMQHKQEHTSERDAYTAELPYDHQVQEMPPQTISKELPVPEQTHELDST
ncbi:hypothetical protein KCU93_g8813, partial [Aureobasidium melanogenum]